MDLEAKERIDNTRISPSMRWSEEFANAGNGSPWLGGGVEAKWSSNMGAVARQNLLTAYLS